MTLPKLTSSTAELEAYRDELRGQLLDKSSPAYEYGPLHDHVCDLVCELLDIINRRESCPHEDFTENLEGRTCRTCGLEMPDYIDEAGQEWPFPDTRRKASETETK